MSRRAVSIAAGCWLATACWLGACASPSGATEPDAFSETLDSGSTFDAPLSIRDAGLDAITATADVSELDSGRRYDIDLAGTTVSGISSGGFMAVQFHVAFASFTRGAAIFAAGPYDCSQASVSLATTQCAYGVPPIDVAHLVSLTHSAAGAGDIDDPSALIDDRVFLFGGAFDTVVAPTVLDALASYYGAFMPAASIEYVSRRAGTAHTWPTASYGNACAVLAPPYLGACGYDGAGHALASLLGSLAPAAAVPTGELRTIAQTDFTADAASHSLDTTAYLYVPASCARREPCRVHIAFHGCGQGARAVGDAFYAHAGLNEWADTNHLIVLYPQAIASSFAPQNPAGCWDWWGYDSPGFASRTGPQLAMVRAMLDAIASE